MWTHSWVHSIMVFNLRMLTVVKYDVLCLSMFMYNDLNSKVFKFWYVKPNLAAHGVLLHVEVVFCLSLSVLFEQMDESVVLTLCCLLKYLHLFPGFTVLSFLFSCHSCHYLNDEQSVIHIQNCFRPWIFSEVKQLMKWCENLPLGQYW